MAKPKPPAKGKVKKKLADRPTDETRHPSPMTVDQAVGLIFGRLCREERERGPDAEMDPQTLRRELGIPEDLFNEARRALRRPADDQDLYLAYNLTTRRWKLGGAWRAKCEEASRKARQPGMGEGRR